MTALLFIILGYALIIDILLILIKTILAGVIITKLFRWVCNAAKVIFAYLKSRAN